MSNVPTGITAYRNPETGEIAGSYQPNKVMAHLTADGVNRLGDTIYELRMEVERWKKAAEANIEENVQLRLLISDMEAARDAALRLKVERQPELGRIADALFEYNERDTQDAARYRWLRDIAEATDWEMFGYQDRGRRDAAIDDAMGGGDGHS